MLVGIEDQNWNLVYAFMEKVYHTFNQLEIEVPAYQYAQ